jgi:alkanesulfonate monooxygenase SsuD/methylene tetrahydromethanopterin reductase-like flavin-dependent oxidoreductase (luciferase family)
MSKKMMLINGFAQVCAATQNYGQWKDEADRTSREYKDLDYWVHLAKVCERGFFDSMFFADVHGTYDVYNGSAETCIRYGVQVPGTDPTVLPTVLARETDHIGFIVTYSTSYFSPFHAAKLFSTLDHYTKGRIGWNIVTSYLDSAYRNGLGEQISHDERYDRADEYMEVCYKLWEQSWDDDAVVFDVGDQHVRRPLEGLQDQSQGTVLRGRGAEPVRSVNPAHPAPGAGRRIRARSSVRWQTRRGDLLGRDESNHSQSIDEGIARRSRD